MDLSIIIVNYNTAELIKTCIESIVNKTKGVSYEIIVVDNASSDNGLNMLRRFSEIVLIVNNENEGFSKANNRGARMAKGDFLFFVNPDTLFLNNVASELINFLKKHNKAAFVGPKLYKNLNGEYHPSIRKFTSPYNLYFIFLPGARHVLGFYNNFLSKINTVREVDWLWGAALLTRKSTFEALGGFDEIFFMFSEEEDLFRRAKLRKYINYYVPRGQMVHFKGKSTEQKKAESIRNLWTSKIIYLQKYYSKKQIKFGLKILKDVLITKLFLRIKHKNNFNLYSSIIEIINKYEKH